MANRRSSIANRPFKALDTLLARKKIRLPEVHLPALPARPLTEAEERELFRDAMADVIPLTGKSNVVPTRKGRPPVRMDVEQPDNEAYQRLCRLVETGEGFVLKHTAEYVEGAAEWLPPEIFRRLHGGHFAVQGHVDLHGLNLAAAQAHFDRFMQRAVRCSMRAVLVVHGRGRSSPGPPVIKRHLYRWLVSGRWKRWVIAFTSARSCDGGTGATYVLLRQSPRSARR